MGFAKKICLSGCLLGVLLIASCGEGPAVAEAEWNLTCPTGGGSVVPCGTLAPDTCLGNVGQRAVFGAHGEMSCTGGPIVAICEATQRSDGSVVLTLIASVLNPDVNDTLVDFAFELRGAIVNPGSGSMTTSSGCNVTIMEDGVAYDIGTCGADEPSIEQPCQISNVVVGNSEISMGVECKALFSRVLETAFDVKGLDGGLASMRFTGCSGF